MTSIERVPVATEIDLKPSTEVHGIWNWRYADIAEIAGAVSGGDVHATAERNLKVCEIAANSHLVEKAAMGAPQGVGLQVVESEVIVDEVADRLNAMPSRRCAGEGRPGKVTKPVGVAIAAAQEEYENVVRKVSDFVLGRVRLDVIRSSAIVDQKAGRDF